MDIFGVIAKLTFFFFFGGGGHFYTFRVNVQKGNIFWEVAIMSNVFGGMPDDNPDIFIWVNS